MFQANCDFHHVWLVLWRKHHICTPFAIAIAFPSVMEPFNVKKETWSLGERPPLRHCIKKRITTLDRKKISKAGLPRNTHSKIFFWRDPGFGGGVTTGRLPPDNFTIHWYHFQIFHQFRSKLQFTSVCHKNNILMPTTSNKCTTIRSELEVPNSNSNRCN
jgi:hypothetical protein